ncbi:alpha/beta hydrolase, partial [Candidatus Saccharibacteria bacterium]|nr:alpha/beta hydrolase [Candidatus Saccharibacteria bacterium]
TQPTFISVPELTSPNPAANTKPWSFIRRWWGRKDVLDKFLHQTLHLPYRLRVAHDRRGQNEKATLIFWHGVAASSAVWDKTFDTISHDSTFDQARLVAIDLLGFGKSPAPDWSDYTIDDHLRALRQTVRRLHIKTPIILVGHSMGALLAVEYATAYPDNRIRALALVSPPLLQPGTNRDRLYRQLYDKILTAARVKKLDSVAGFFDKFTSFEADAAAKASSRRSMQRVVIDSRAFHQIKKLRLPIHIFHGSLDLLVSGANIKHFAEQKNITVHIAPSGHDVVGQKKQQLIKVLGKLIENVLI